MLFGVVEYTAVVDFRSRNASQLPVRRRTRVMTPARPSPPEIADDAEGRTSMRSTSDSGIVLRSNWPLDEYDAESPALRPFISTSVVPRGNPRIWTVVEFAFPPPPMPFPSPIEISPLLLTETSDRYRSEEHTSELKSLMRISYAVFCL